MREKVRAFIEEKGLIAPGQSVLVAFSGGADSTALLCILCDLGRICGFGEIAAAHFNHGLRQEADGDEAAVRRFCECKGIRLFTEKQDVAAAAKASHKGVEETGRRMRYAFFRQVAETEGFDLIATAHTKSDQAETVLLHLTRGCGPDALSGIPAKRDRIIRPLLCCSRREIESYCADNDLPYLTDATNSDVRYARNRVRHLVIPQLKEINPRVEEAAFRLSAAAAEDAAYWNGLVERTLADIRVEKGVYSAGKLADLPPSLKRRVLHRLAGIGAEEAHIRQLERALTADGSVSLPHVGEIRVSGGLLFTGDRGERVRFTPLPLAPGQTYRFGTDTYKCQVIDRELFEKSQKVHRILLQFTCDYDKIRDSATVSTRMPGDGYAPYRRGGYKSLKKLFNAEKIPVPCRDRIPVIRDGEGIVLVPGLGCDARAAIDGETKRILIFSKIEEE